MGVGQGLLDQGIDRLHRLGRQIGGGGGARYLPKTEQQHPEEQDHVTQSAKLRHWMFPS